MCTVKCYQNFFKWLWKMHRHTWTYLKSPNKFQRASFKHRRVNVDSCKTKKFSYYCRWIEMFCFHSAMIYLSECVYKHSGYKWAVLSWSCDPKMAADHIRRPLPCKIKPLLLCYWWVKEFRLFGLGPVNNYHWII